MHLEWWQGRGTSLLWWEAMFTLCTRQLMAVFASQLSLQLLLCMCSPSTSVAAAAAAVLSQALTEFYGSLSADWALECLKELLLTNMQVRPHA